MEGQPLLGVLRGLILDDGAQADFTADPSGYMQRAGYDDMSEDDLSEAVSLVADTLPPDVAHAVTTAAAPPRAGPRGDGGALGMLGRLADIDSDDVAPLEVPEPSERLPARRRARMERSTTPRPDSFGDVDQDFDEPLDPFAGRGGRARPRRRRARAAVRGPQRRRRPGATIDVDVDPAGDEATGEALGFGEGSTRPRQAAADGDGGRGDRRGRRRRGRSRATRSTTPSAATPSARSGDTSALDDPGAAPRRRPTPTTRATTAGDGRATAATARRRRRLDDHGRRGPDIEGGDIGFF